MQLPYLLQLASYAPGTDRYFATLAPFRDTIEPAFVNFQPYTPSQLVKYFVSMPYPGHLYRFDYIPKDLDPDRWWIFTDTTDVIFQTPLPQLDGLGYSVFACPESETHGNNGIWRNIIGQFPQSDILLDKPIYNMGTWAMKGSKALELIQYLKDHRAAFNCHPNSDQLMYNLWLMEQPADIVGVHPTLMVCLYANMEKGYTKKVDGLWRTECGRPYSIVHANGNLKEHL